jgi:sialate O-acetylesterase
MTIHLKAVKIALCCILLSLSCFAEVRLPQLISNSMVLQRDTKLKIWGWASPDERITIKFAGKTFHTTTDAGGKWLIIIPSMKAGGPYTMDISGNNNITISDILIGDVWFCSGQSNMVLQMERVKERYPEEISSADYPDIRNFFVPTASDVKKVHDDLPTSRWVVTSPSTVKSMGAVTYFFAKQLFNKYHVPIGIINSSVGGTPAEAWVSADGFKGFEPYATRLFQIRDSSFSSRNVQPQNRQSSTASMRIPQPDKGIDGPVKWFDTLFVPHGWHKFWMPGYWDDQGTRNLHGIIWFRKEIIVPASMTGHTAKLFLGRIVDADETYVNGVKVGNITYQYPPRRYDIPASILKPGKNIIVVRVTNTSGKGGFVPDKNYSLTDGTENIDLRGEWEYMVGMAQEPFDKIGSGGGKEPNQYIINSQNEPSGLYNTVVAPAINYAIKGILWYQGETNAGRPADYSRIMTTLITDWRSKWNLGTLPFIYVQLPNFMEVIYYPTDSQWAELREQQLKTLAIPNTAMVVTIDLGEWNDIHPLNKKDVGERMALASEKIAYGENLVCSGPIYQSSSVNGNKITISFTNTGSGLIVKEGDELTQFAVAGEDKHFVWASASIEGEKVIVWNDNISNPLYVRYAWADNPEGANLYNKEGLPASPFRTDKP